MTRGGAGKVPALHNRWVRLVDPPLLLTRRLGRSYGGFQCILTYDPKFEKHSREGRQGRRGFSREKRGVRSGLGVMFGFAHAKVAKDEKDGFRREGSTGMMTPSWGMVGRRECGKVFLQQTWRPLRT